MIWEKIMDIFKLGRRKIDSLFMIFWKKGQGIIVGDVRTWPTAVCLEPRSFMSEKIGVLLFKEGWNNNYILAQRGGFSDDDYYSLAIKLFAEKGIHTP